MHRMRRFALGNDESAAVHHHGRRTGRQERSRAPGFEAANKRHFDRKWRGERLRRMGWTLRLAGRHVLWRLRGGPSY
jgi:hypothetical protein